ncbi:MAG: hypothetical protein EP330_30075 [Deltaproteobacteria bacterium]|nr:MAG: hypothetical protein EP330_30075 [Deltaproteobacteria bacterium]
MTSLVLCLLAAHALEPESVSDDSGAIASTEIGTDYDIGLGVSLGNPTGVTGKFYLDGRRTAIEAALGTETWGPGYGGLYLHGAYLWHPGTVLYDVDFEMAWHIGGGAFLSNFGRDPGNRFDNWSESHLATGLRAQVGLDLDLTVLPLQIYGDVAMNFLIIPKPWPGLHIAAGVRYYF